MKKPLIIGICGGSGSGKTTFIRKLRDMMGDEELSIISQDDYYKQRDRQKEDTHGVKNFDLPKSIEKKAFAQDILKLIEGETVYREEYTFNNDLKKAAMLEIRPAPVIVVEGIFVFHFKRIRKMLDIKVFLHSKENLKVIRRIKRDQSERNYPLDDVLYRYEHHVLPTFERYIAPYRDMSDIVINNNEHFDVGLMILTGFIHNYLRS